MNAPLDPRLCDDPPAGTFLWRNAAVDARICLYRAIVAAKLAYSRIPRLVVGLPRWRRLR